MIMCCLVSSHLGYMIMFCLLSSHLGYTWSCLALCQRILATYHVCVYSSHLASCAWLVHSLLWLHWLLHMFKPCGYTCIMYQAKCCMSLFDSSLVASSPSLWSESLHSSLVMSVISGAQASVPIMTANPCDKPLFTHIWKIADGHLWRVTTWASKWQEWKLVSCSIWCWNVPFDGLMMLGDLTAPTNECYPTTCSGKALRKLLWAGLVAVILIDKYLSIGCTGSAVLPRNALWVMAFSVGRTLKLPVAVAETNKYQWPGKKCICIQCGKVKLLMNLFKQL